MSIIVFTLESIMLSAIKNVAKWILPEIWRICNPSIYYILDGASSPPLRKEFSLSDPLLGPMRSTPKYSKVSAVGSSVSKMHPMESPLPLNVSTHNVSFGISSPFRALNISASSLVSPLANFIQSPEIIEKVTCIEVKYFLSISLQGCEF